MTSIAMLHHMSFGVADLARSGAFYDAVLAPLGYERVFTHPKALGYGYPGSAGEKFAIRPQTDATVPGECFHVAFAAPSHEAVDAFYQAALANGGKDNGGTGFHPEYGKEYYAAFVFDPDGYRIEAVIHHAV